MRLSRTNMRLAAARCRSLLRKIGVQTAEFSITAFCWRNADSRKSRTYERHNAEIRLELFNLSIADPGRGALVAEAGIRVIGAVNARPCWRQVSAVPPADPILLEGELLHPGPA